jgi:ferredoxin
MREFVKRHLESLKNKKIIIFCTQLIFSGDGARVFTSLFPRNFVKVIYAEHFFMPNNVCNFFILPLANKRKIEKYKTKAEKKMQTVCSNITNGVIKKRGFNTISQMLGLIQGVFIPIFEEKMQDSVYISKDCIQCSLCISICPMGNFENQNGKIEQKHNCTFCYRCINRCPQKAIALFFHKKVKEQYKGLQLS